MPGLAGSAVFDPRDGLPLSMQISGRPFDDARVLRAGHAFERATGLNRAAAYVDSRPKGRCDRPQTVGPGHRRGRALCPSACRERGYTLRPPTACADLARN